MAVATDSRERIDLAGEWQIAFDPAGQGIAAGWASGSWPQDRAETTNVPGIWERTHPDTEGIGFYRGFFTIPADWAQQLLHLRFGGASYRTDVWLNGQYLDSHEGAYTPFWFDATPAARIGAENELVVRVAGLSRTREIDGQPLQQAPDSKQSWYYIESGLWGDVSLEAVPLLSCHDVVVQPDLRQEAVGIEVVIRNAYQDARQVALSLGVHSPTGDVVCERRARVMVPPGMTKWAYRLGLPRPQRWSCEAPFLYRLETEIAANDEVADRRVTTFGMRDFGVRDGQFFLNGDPVYIRGVLLQPNYPIGLIAPPTREMMAREIRLVKEAGFNMIRAHLRPAPPGYLDLTDEMGMLVYAESSLAWIRESPRWLDHATREMQALIERDRNHPSVVIWGLHNENRAASAATSDALIPFVRSLDPTRVIVDNSGGTMAIDQDFGWTDRATVVTAGETERQPIQDLHIYVGAPIPHGVYEWLRALGQSPSPIDIRAYGFGSPAMLADWHRGVRTYQGKTFVSELGCGGMADLDEVVAGYEGQEFLRDAREMRAFRDSLHEGFAARGLDRIFGTVPKLVSASQEVQARGNSRQVEALLVNPRVSGFLVTQLNDVAWEFHAGMLDPWRNPKQTYDAFKRLNQPDCLILNAPVRVVTIGDRGDVTLSLVQAVPPESAEEVVVTVFGPDERILKTENYLVPPGAGIKELGRISFAAENGPGDYRVVAQLVRDGESLADTAESVLALPMVKIPTMPVGDQDGLVVAHSPGSLSQHEWDALLAAADAGGVGVIGPLRPEDDLALSMLAERGVQVDLHFGIGNWMGCYHWIPGSDVFDGLPASGLAGEAYADVLPHYVMSELGGRVFAGSFRNTQTRREAPAMIWYSDIEAIQLGRGKLILCQYRLFDQADTNPLAARFLGNLLHLARARVATKQSEESRLLVQADPWACLDATGE
ncbi:MAG: glycoside hydrolase family 2 protein [Thermomicrobiales bacterium]